MRNVNAAYFDPDDLQGSHSFTPMSVTLRTSLISAFNGSFPNFKTYKFSFDSSNEKQKKKNYNQ